MLSKLDTPQLKSGFRVSRYKSESFKAHNYDLIDGSSKEPQVYPELHY